MLQPLDLIVRDERSARRLPDVGAGFLMSRWWSTPAPAMRQPRIARQTRHGSPPSPGPVTSPRRRNLALGWVNGDWVLVLRCDEQASAEGLGSRFDQH